MRIILASQSPRRRDLLNREGFEFDVITREADELHDARLSPEELCAHNAALKAEAVAHEHPEAIVIGADTLVYLDDEPLGKPQNEDDALEMLTRLQGRTHCVCTAVAVYMPGGERRDFAERSYVTFKPMSRQALERYIEQVYVLDKAGAYSMQDNERGCIVERVEGDEDNVVGLPVTRLKEVLGQA